MTFDADAAMQFFQERAKHALDGTHSVYCPKRKRPLSKRKAKSKAKALKDRLDDQLIDSYCQAPRSRYALWNTQFSPVYLGSASRMLVLLPITKYEESRLYRYIVELGVHRAQRVNDEARLARHLDIALRAHNSSAQLIRALKAILPSKLIHSSTQVLWTVLEADRFEIAHLEP
jgi:hypothetical protein